MKHSPQAKLDHHTVLALHRHTIRPDGYPGCWIYTNKDPYVILPPRIRISPRTASALIAGTIPSPFVPYKFRLHHITPIKIEDPTILPLFLFDKHKSIEAMVRIRCWNPEHLYATPATTNFDDVNLPPPRWPLTDPEQRGQQYLTCRLPSNKPRIDGCFHPDKKSRPKGWQHIAKDQLTCMFERSITLRGERKGERKIVPLASRTSLFPVDMSGGQAAHEGTNVALGPEAILELVRGNIRK